MPKNIAIDAPSKLFLKFMHKYFGLHKYIPQNSNFVFYEEFFDEDFFLKIGFNKKILNHGLEFYRFQRPIRIRK